MLYFNINSIYLFINISQPNHFYNFTTIILQLIYSATKLCQQLHWLPVRQRIIYKLAVITYKTRTTSTPYYLSHLIHDYNHGRCLRSADKLLLTVPRTSLTLSASAFSVSAPAVWNSLSHLTVDPINFSVLLPVC